MGPYSIPMRSLAPFQNFVSGVGSRPFLPRTAELHALSTLGGQLHQIAAGDQVIEGPVSVLLHPEGRSTFAQCPTISRVLMPRAYIEMILSSKPGNRR